jgi:uncharacterized peroxidase-related enzyme
LHKSEAMARIRVIQENEAEGMLHEVYQGLIKSRGKLAEVHKIQSLNPKTIISHMELYMDIMYGQSPLKRWQREMIAVIVSKTNQCEYCTRHHAEALLVFWKDEVKVNMLAEGKNISDLDSINQLWIELAKKLTANPHSPEIDTTIQELKKLGTDDRSILDATLVIAYFNFVNRIILGLGVELETDNGKGYKYE